jgi:threonine/homoserine/homoserine lactone efflux protein
MEYFIEGLLFGLFLAFAMGPIFITLSQTAIEKGWRAGMAVGFGVWVSDFLYIYFSYKFVKSLESTFSDPVFKYWASIIGGGVLILFGIYLIFRKKTLDTQTLKLTAKNFAQYFVKGFIVNAVNPFTPIFWFGVISTSVLARGISMNATYILMGTIMAVIIVSDSLKVLLASFIRSRLNQKHMHYISVLSGAFLLIFGLLMIYHSN